MVRFARNRANLAVLAAEIGGTAGEPADAATADLVVLSVPWGVIDQALAQAGSLAGRIVIDTTNQFGRGVTASLDGRKGEREREKPTRLHWPAHWCWALPWVSARLPRR